MGAQRAAPFCAVLGNQLFVIGGNNSTAAGGLQTGEVSTLFPDGGLSAFTSLGTLLADPCEAPAPLVLDGMVYVLGGDNGNNFLQGAPTYPDGGLGAFATLQTHYIDGGTEYGAASAYSGDELYLFGGFEGGNQFAAYDAVGSAQSEPDGGLGVVAPSGSPMASKRFRAFAFTAHGVVTVVTGAQAPSFAVPSFVTQVEQGPAW
jgi:hypothetical protein